MVLVGAASAQAFEDGGRRHGLLWDRSNQGSFWGNFGFSDTSTLVFCGDNARAGVGTGSPYGNRSRVTSWVSDTGQSVPAADLHLVGYLLEKNGQTTNDRVAAVTAVSIWTLLRSNGYDIRQASNPASVRAARIDDRLRPEALALLEEAASLAGPYTAEVTMPSEGTAGGSVRAALTLRSAAGNPVPGRAVTLTMPGAQPVTGRTDAQGVFAATFTVPTGASSARVDGSVTGLPGTFDVLQPSDRTAQRAILSGSPVTVSASASTTVPVQVRPSVTTQTSQVVLAPGDEVADQVMVRDGLAGASFTGTSTLYGPFDEEPALADRAPEDAPVVGTAPFSGTFDTDNSASVRTSALTVEKPGYYVWQETLNAGPQWDTVVGRFGVATETSVALAPTITTEVSTQSAMVGDTISDAVTVTGIRTSVGGQALVNTVTGVLAGPLAPVDGSCADLDWSLAPTRPIAPFQVTADGTVGGVDEHVVTEPGCFSYGETLTVTLDGETVHEVDHPVGHTTQTVITAGFTPRTATQASSQLVAAGAEVWDTVIIDDCRPGAEVSGSASLYGPYAAAPELGSDPDPELLVGTVAFADVCGEDGSVTTRTESLVMAADAGSGYYVWHERLEASSFWDEVVAEFGAPSETSLLMTPTIATQVSAQEVLVGATISDTVIVDGIFTEVGGTALTHEVSGALHGPLAPVDGSCADLDWSSAPSRSIEPFAVTASGSFAGIDEHEVAEAGCYTYSEVLTSWLGAQEEPVSVVVHEPGHETQTFLAAAPPEPGPPAQTPTLPAPGPVPPTPGPVIHAGIVGGPTGLLLGSLVLLLLSGIAAQRARRP